jgi:hypothetical protein
VRAQPSPQVGVGLRGFFFFEKLTGALLCHLSEEKQVQSFTGSILHKKEGTQTRKQIEVD